MWCVAEHFRLIASNPASQRDRLRLWLSRLHSFRAKISQSVRPLARRSRPCIRSRWQWNSAYPYRLKGATGTRRLASGCLNPLRKIDPGNQDGSSQELASG
jgi:hypothetical protein